MTRDTRRPDGRTVAMRRAIGGRIQQSAAMRDVTAAFDLGKRIAELRAEHDGRPGYDLAQPNDVDSGESADWWAGYRTGMADILADDERAALTPSEYWQVYSDVVNDLGSVGRPVDGEDLADEDDDLMDLADAVAEPPSYPCAVPDGWLGDPEGYPARKRGGHGAVWWITHRPSRHARR